MKIPTSVSWLVTAAALATALWFGLPAFQAQPTAPDAHNDHGHVHDEHAHGSENTIALSQQALKNIGFAPIRVEESTFTRTISVPALVVERPGRSQIQITTPLTGVITKIHIIEGEAIEPGSPLFEVRLTHEDMVVAQREFLQSVEQLDVVNRELTRLESIGEGVIAGKRILEQKYEQQKLLAVMKAQRQGLLLHGLSDEQVDNIIKHRELLPKLTVRAPEHTDETESCTDDHLFHVQELDVQLGQQVSAGHRLCLIADHCELYVEGRAFEDDAGRLRIAAEHDWPVMAHLLTADADQSPIAGLRLLYLEDHVHLESRAFNFYLRLSNQITSNRKVGVHRFIQWRFRPGQRLELEVPVEKWPDRIVLPVTAVVEEGPESYVFRQSGNTFERLPVHVDYRDHEAVVIEPDAEVSPGVTLAARGAYQMHLAIKNKSGGGIDPHAGHHH